ncbi:putative ribonuclease H1/H2 small subunit [Trypanosoma theileri]|uniref:Putative ribonuclease H1/H2 small subunit n=1 Tax=Trypanosoma theileri TaxID=67003 RepID=A0A1X0NN29_9TRYP|nr:putative ribonuclease H1/H2 small subunit [Trypanosoma theileri]ORC85898.1 putative ribonuclease H1/H2 small subunit [Trypanosoma theileri]
MGEDHYQQQQQASVVHSLPIKTNFRGTTDVDENFTKYVKRSENGDLHNNFRGRTLIGREVLIPPSYVLICAGLFKQEQKSPFDAAGQSTSTSSALAQVEASAADVSITATTDRYYLWDHDKRPERSQALQQWIELSHAVHLPTVDNTLGKA